MLAVPPHLRQALQVGALSVLGAAALVRAAVAQIPGLPSLPGFGGGGRAPAPWLSTSLADARTEVPFLDDYDPAALAPLAEMPRGLRDAFLLPPGAYEMYAESYCLHAGSHGPGGQGNGYISAPAAGKGASVVTTILERASLHPEIEQHRIQLLLWALLSQSSFDALDPSLQEAGRALLDAEQLAGLARGQASAGEGPSVDLLGELLGHLPAEARMVLEAEATIRNAFQRALPAYAEIESIAVLAGEARRREGDREVPEGRWSLLPQGVFVSYFPSSYTSTLVEVCVPGGCKVQLDAQGRIVRVQAADGSSIEADYQGDLQAVEGDAGLRQATFREVRLSQAVRTRPGAFHTAVLKGGQTLVGLPDAGSPPVAASDLHRFAVNHRDQVQRLYQAMASKDARGEAAVSAQQMRQLVGLACFTRAVHAQMRLSTSVDVRDGMAGPGYEAWQSLLVARTPEKVVARHGARLAWSGLVRHSGTLLASDVPVRVAASGSSGWGSFFPSDSIAQPSHQGSQRLGQSGRGRRDGERPNGRRNPRRERPDGPDKDSWKNKDILVRARDSMSAFENIYDAVGFATDASGTIAGKMAGLPGDSLKGAMFDFIFESAGQISQSLGGDPPRADFDRVAEPQVVPVQRLVPKSKKAAVPGSLLCRLLELHATLQAAHITRDRLGGAIAARSEMGIERQSRALLVLKRKAGEGWIKVAESIERELLPRLAGRELERAERLQAAERRASLSPAQLQDLGRTLGLEPEQIQAVVERWAAEKQADEGSAAPEALRETVEACRALGSMWLALPAGE